MLPDLHTCFSGSREGDLVFPFLSGFSIVYCDYTVKGLSIVNEAEVDAFLELSNYNNHLKKKVSNL